jgi:hypothetical protein
MAMKIKKITSELDQPVWALISFHKVIERDLTFEQAARLRDAQPKLSNEFVVITNDAADRIHAA